MTIACRQSVQAQQYRDRQFFNKPEISAALVELAEK